MNVEALLGSMPPNLGGAMLAAERRSGAARAVFDVGGQEAVLSHAALCSAARSVAAGLAALGLARGDVLAVQMPTRPATMIAHAAAAWLGLTLLPVIHIYQDEELDFILVQSGAKALITPAAFRNVDYAARRAFVRSRFPQLIQIVDGEGEPGTHPFASLADRPPLSAPAETGADEIAMLIYTSGTTARPKGVQHSHRGLMAELAIDAARRGGLTMLSPWPPGHVAGVIALMRFWAMGQSGVFMESWDGSAAAGLIEKHGVQATSGTPFHITTLLDAAEADGRDISSLFDYLAGATAISPALIDRCQRAGIATYRSYGLSEHPTVSSGSPTDPLDRRLTTDGRLNPGVSVRIVDDAGRDLPLGQAGEIWTQGPERFVGYRDAARNGEALTAEGWLKTGDIGTLDADGYLTVTDRKKDIIIRGGENIASREVEDVLALMPGVREAAVVGAPDELLGERVCAFLTVESGAAIDLAAVQAHFAARSIARQKTPERLRVVDSLPRNAAGKILKADLRAVLRSELPAGGRSPDTAHTKERTQ